MNSLTRRSFVKSVGLGAGLAALPPTAGAAEPSAMPDVPMPETSSNKGELRFRQVHLDFHTSPLIPGCRGGF